MCSEPLDGSGNLPLLVLGLGNPLLADDGAGLAVLALLEKGPNATGAEFLDGGTQGLALLPHIAGRRGLLVLDALKLGSPAGTVHVLDGWNHAVTHASTAHESNVAELLAASAMLGEMPEQVKILGIEPARIVTGFGLSPEVSRALTQAVETARAVLEGMATR